MRGVTQLAFFQFGVIKFQLTRLMRGVTCLTAPYWLKLLEFQLTRLMRGVTQVKYHTKYHTKISTHTPHARRDA